MKNDDFRLTENPHNVVMESRQKCSVSGVLEVLSFDENEIVMETSRGTLTIGGENLNVEKLSLDIGELTLEGDVDALIYADDTKGKKGFWSKIF